MKEKSKKPDKVSDVLYRGYCRICNRFILYKDEVDPEHTQFHQHHGGVCQRHRHKCMQVKSWVRG